VDLDGSVVGLVGTDGMAGHVETVVVVVQAQRFVETVGAVVVEETRMAVETAVGEVGVVGTC